MRRGFSLIAAMFFMLVISTVGMLALSYSTMSSKTTGDLFLKEQAKILAIAGTEYAVMAMQSHNYRNYDIVCPSSDSATAKCTVENDPKNPGGNSCLNEVNLFYPQKDENNRLFNIKIGIDYIDKNLNCDSKNTIGLDGSGQYKLGLPTHAAVVTVAVESTDLVPGNKIRYVRRTLQIP